MKVAIVHYWWISNRGGEAVVAEIARVFPNADIFLHVYDEKALNYSLPKEYSGQIYTTFISKLPGAKTRYQKYLPFMPMALEQLNLQDYDLVISSESGPAKGVITRPDCLHVCYCHSPMRYVWDNYYLYLKDAGFITRLIMPPLMHYLRIWDVSTSARVDTFIANSNFVKNRIKKYYRRDSLVIHPPVNVNAFDHTAQREKFFLCLGQLVDYKRVDIAVDAFNSIGDKLLVIGEGEAMNKLKKRSASNIEFMGRQPFEVVKNKLETCAALIFPGVEDFGIVPVEAMAAGAPVIAYGAGGVKDSVIDGETGIFFYEQSSKSLINAVNYFKNNKPIFSSERIRRHAEGFRGEKFSDDFRKLIFKELESVKGNDT